MRLTQPGEGSEDTKRRVPIEQLGDPTTIDPIINRLTEVRLITAEESFPRLSESNLFRDGFSKDPSVFRSLWRGSYVSQVTAWLTSIACVVCSTCNIPVRGLLRNLTFLVVGNVVFVLGIGNSGCWLKPESRCGLLSYVMVCRSRVVLTVSYLHSKSDSSAAKWRDSSNTSKPNDERDGTTTVSRLTRHRFNVFRRSRP
jgi:hypothetical protein